MEPNVGSLDRMLRVCIALVFIAAAYFYNVWWLYALALVPLATALFSYCPLYAPLKISTIEKKEEAKEEPKKEEPKKRKKQRK
ncbi:MAG: DUF2892 domain-containing protein [Candidatus Anstonellales archaeon]